MQKVKGCWVVSLVLFTLTEGKTQLTEPRETIAIGNTKQLFIDDKLIQSRKSVDFVMNRPYSTGEVLIETDLPHEAGGEVYLYSSVLKDNEGKVKIWYDFLRQKSKTDPYDHDRHVGYAESADGIHFTKPDVGLHALNGSKKNNVVLPGIIGGSAVWLDPQAPPAHRYKTQAKVYPSGKLHMHSSPDGINWKFFSEINPRGPFDTQTIVFWDENISQHVLYGRHFVDRKEGDELVFRRRGVRRAILENYQDVKDTGVVLWPDFIDQGTYSDKVRQNPVDYYGATVFPYSETKGVYIMLTQAFWHWVTDTEFQGTGEPGTRDIRLEVSRDGSVFSKAGARKAFITPGPLGRFDSRQIWAMPNPIVMGDEIWIYYCGVNWDRAGRIDPMAPGGKKKSAITRAVMRLDGFVSLDAPYDAVGEVVTKPVTFEGGKLEINTDTGGGGSIRVEILEEDGTPIPGFTLQESDWIVGNSVRYPVTWKGKADVKELEGKPVRLRFVMRDARLYAFQFK